jgi:hypothetical protein
MFATSPPSVVHAAVKALYCNISLHCAARVQCKLIVAGRHCSYLSRDSVNAKEPVNERQVYDVNAMATVNERQVYDR